MPIQLIAELNPKNNADFALLDDMYLRGGFHVVDNLTTRNSIPIDRRKHGMKVFVQTTDLVYELQSDLTSWIIDRALTLSLQAAYNGGAEILTTVGNPFILTGPDAATQIFKIRTISNDVMTASSDGTIEIFNKLRNKDYTSSINYSVNGNAVNIILDRTDSDIYRAIQYFYTISNSDNSGFETGQLFIIHNNTNATVYAIIGNSVGVPCSLSFSVQISGHELQLVASTTDSSPFSRVIHLFKIALI
jgi:hypothetical protein